MYVRCVANSSEMKKTSPTVCKLSKKLTDRSHQLCVCKVCCKQLEDEMKKTSPTVCKLSKKLTDKSHQLCVCKVCCKQFRDEEDESHSM